MHRYANAAIVGAFALSLPFAASAADLGRGSIKDAPPPPPREEYAEPFYNWQGLYAGGFVGGASQTWTVDFYRNNNHGHAELDASGLAYGAWIGYNMMLSSRIVLGIEADIGKANASQSNNIFDNDTSYSTIDTFGSIRGRFGYAIDRFLVYGTAGLAFGNVTNDIQKGRNAGEEIVYDDQWETGYAVGGGLEYAFAPNLIGRVEYIYSNYGMVSLFNRDNNLTEMTNEMHLARVGLSYRF